MNKTILTNARIVLPTETIEGSLVVEGDRIAEIIPAVTSPKVTTFTASGSFPG